MNTITIPKKEYQQLARKQAQTAAQVSVLREIVKRLVQDELRPAYVKKLEKQSVALDNGKGKYFNTLKQFRSYLAAL